MSPKLQWPEPAGWGEGRGSVRPGPQRAQCTRAALCRVQTMALKTFSWPALAAGALGELRACSGAPFQLGRRL